MIRPLWQVLVHASQDDAPLSCDECYVLMDYLADLLAAGINSKQVISLADRYLSRCPDCDVEYVYTLNSRTPSSEVPVEEDARVTHAKDLTRT